MVLYLSLIHIYVDLDISNRTGDSMDVSLSESSLPEGFEGYFSGNGNRISRVHVAPNAMSAGVVYRLTIPDDAAEGTYEIRLAAASDNGLSDVMTMELNITEQEYGQSSFTCEYPQQEGTSGTTFNFNTTLINNGADTQSYSLSAEAPAGWQVSFKPSGSSTQVASLDAVSYTHLDVYKRQMASWALNSSVPRSASPASRMTGRKPSSVSILAAATPSAPLLPCLLYTSLSSLHASQDINLLECFYLHREAPPLVLTVPKTYLWEIRTLLEQMDHYHKLEQEDSPDILKCALHTKFLFGRFMLFVNQFFFSQYRSRIPASMEIYASQVYEICEYIQRHYEEDLSVEELTRIFPVRCV